MRQCLNQGRGAFKDFLSFLKIGLFTIGGGYAIISCHNTILHYLVCTGIVGLVLSLPFLVYKYVILCNTNFIFCSYVWK